MRLLRAILWRLDGIRAFERIEEDTPNARFYRSLRRIAQSRGKHANGGGIRFARLGS